MQVVRTNGHAPLVDIGVDVLNPIQAPDAHIDPEGLEWDFGDAASLRGDTHTSLASSPPGQVQVEVERSLNRPGPRGRRTVSYYGSTSQERVRRSFFSLTPAPS